MRSHIADKIATLPHSPGVYIMRDAKGGVFYIGKAKSLRDRVRSYFSGSDTRPFVSLLDRMLADLDVVLTNNEKEAMLVESELIKEHSPRFNVHLKDDKRFLCIRLDTRERYPRLQVVRRFGKDGARYFGPYHSAHSLREVVRLVNRHFQLRTCNDQMLTNRVRPCLQYQIKRCPAPCVFDLSHGEYAQNVESVIAFLEGKETELIATLESRMRARASEEAFEAAALIRDQMLAVQRSLERQKLVTSDFVNRDVVGIYREGPHVEVHVMRTREGRLIDAQRFSFDGLEQETSEILSDFAGRYYTSENDVPDEILFPPEFEWDAALADVLSERRGRRVAVLTPQRGEKARLIELAVRNAHQAFVDKQREAGAAKTSVEKLQRALHLRRPPERIECFDISHFQGGQIVASLVRFDHGMPNKDLYRRYKIRTTAGQDDFQSMYEVINRRARRGLEEQDLPDLIVIDGGKGQLAAARAALDDHAVHDVELISLAKSRVQADEIRDVAAAVDMSDLAVLEAASDSLAGAEAVSEMSQVTLDSSDVPTEVQRSPERVFVSGRKDAVVLRQNSAELFLLTRARDEAHRFAITFHRQLRGKASTRSALDNIPGVGPKRRKLLLRTFGSITRLRAASLEDIAKIVGTATARKVIEGLGDTAAKDTT